MAFPGSGRDLRARGGRRFYWCLFYFCFYFEPVKIEDVTLPESETAAVEQDNWLPKLDVPDVIQQKVIPGKTEGGQVQHDPPQKKSWHPSSWGSLRALLQLVRTVWGGKGPCSSPRQGVSSGCCHPRGLMPRAACPHGQVEGHRSHPSCGARLDDAAESGERWVTGSAPPAAAQ